nr:hypothetical protein [Tanacetum cinerariifolium]
MSTQQDIYADGSENRPSMLNKDNYIPWSSHLLRDAKSKPNEKFLYNSIINGPYVRRMIAKLADLDRDVLVAESFHEQTDDELTEKKAKQMEADDQEILTILMGLPEDIYATVDSCDTAQEIWLRAQQMMKGFDIRAQEKKNRLIDVLEIANQNVNGNIVSSQAEGNSNGNNGDIDEIEEFNANCILMANLQQASTSSTQTVKALVYDLDGLAEVHHYENCYNNEIFNMFTQREQYTKLLEPITEPHPVQQNTSNAIFDEPSVEHNGGIVEQHPATIEETHAYFESLYNNLVIKVEKVITTNRKRRESNADLTTELARYKGQEKCFEINQETYDKLKNYYLNSVYQEQCLAKKINALHLSSAKTITTLMTKLKI